MQASLDESSGKLQEAQQALQSAQSSSVAQQVQLTQQLTSQTEQLATARQVGMLTPKPMSIPTTKAAHNQHLMSKPVAKPVQPQIQHRSCVAMYCMTPVKAYASFCGKVCPHTGPVIRFGSNSNPVLYTCVHLSVNTCVNSCNSVVCVSPVAGHT